MKKLREKETTIRIITDDYENKLKKMFYETNNLSKSSK